jgi:hypothetical protein
MEHRNRENLKKELSSLSTSEYQEIFNILRNNNISYTENKNGVFINLKNTNDDIIYKIYDFIEFCKDNKKNLETLDERQKEHVKNTTNTKQIRSYNISVNNDDIMNNIEDTNINNKKLLPTENFTFQNFIDKFTITNMKMFPENEKIIYPVLKQVKCNFTGVKYRILKRCRDISKMTSDKFTNLLFFEMEDGQLDTKNNEYLNNTNENLFEDNDNYDKSDDENDDEDDE